MRAPHVAALLALALAATATLQARADEDAKEPAGKPPASSEDASQRFKAGVSFYKDKDFPAALVEFKRAYELLPNYNVLFNLGQTARELRDYAAALTAFERYLRDGGAKIPAARRKEVGAAVDELRRKVGNLKIVTSVDGAAIVVDDVPVGVSPLAAPLVVNAGRRKVEASSSGYPPVQRMVDVASMEETRVSLDFTRSEATPTPIPTPTPTPTESAWKVPPRVRWVTLSGTAAFAVAAGVTGGLALSAHGSLDSALAAFPGNGATIASAQSRTRTFATATDALGTLAAAGAVTTAVLFFVVPRLSERATVAASPAGVVVSGAF